MRSLVIIFLTLFIGTAFAQHVPSAAKAKLKALYPKAESVKWDTETPNYEANFEVNDVEMSLLFDAKGNVLETETELGKNGLPKTVQKAISKDFKGYSIEETTKIDRDGKTTFEAELKKGEHRLDAIYSAKGKLIKKVIKKEKNEEAKESSEKDEEDND